MRVRCGKDKEFKSVSSFTCFFEIGFMHVDDLNVMREDSGLFSANIYLQTLESSSNGGSLHIWPVRWKTRWDFYRNAPTLSQLLVQDSDGQQLLRSKFPPPLVITPKDGDLILLCAQRPHAVQGFELGERVSMQAFLTFNNKEPLVLEN